VKRLSLSLLAVAVLATSSPVWAQNKTQASVSSVGLIDMAHVFQKYDKFADLRNDLQAEIEKSETEGRPKAERLQKMQQELKTNFTVGSQEYEQAEKAFRLAKSDFEAFRASTQRRLARQESEMFKTIYFDVTKAVKLYAQYRSYTMVIRFNRKGIDETLQPKEAVATMNKNVIYHQAENDITEPVLGYLNKLYNKSPGTPARSASDRRRATE